MMRLIAWAIFAAVFVSACGAEKQTAQPGTETPSGEPEAASTAYEVVLANAISDTLRGSASFGRVRHPLENTRHLVIRLTSPYDFAGGVVITRRSPDLPEEGTYPLTTDSTRIASGEHFVIIYREGMLRDLRSVSGSLTLSTVTDSLIAGRFNATLRGYISEGGRDLEAGEVHAVGRFTAERGMSGYVIGL